MSDKRIHELPNESTPPLTSYLIVGDSLLSQTTSKVTLNTITNKYLFFVNYQKSNYINISPKTKYSNMVNINNFDDVFYYDYNEYMAPGSSGLDTSIFAPIYIKNKNYVISYDITIIMNTPSLTNQYILYYKNKIYKTGFNTSNATMNYIKNINTTLNNVSTTTFPISLYNTLKNKITYVNTGSSIAQLNPTSIINNSSIDITSKLPKIYITSYNQKQSTNNNGLLFSFDILKNATQTQFDYNIKGKIKIEII